jgi:hypothetical protein
MFRKILGGFVISLPISFLFMFIWYDGGLQKAIEVASFASGTTLFIAGCGALGIWLLDDE